MNPNPDHSPISMFDLTGCRALVTGARPGIGRAIALAFAAQGTCRHAPRRHPAGAARRRIRPRRNPQPQRHGQLFAANFEPAGAGAQLAAAATAAFGPIDILVLNASIELLEDYDAIPTESFDRQIAVNLRAPLELVQALLPSMKQSGWGRILAIGSVQQLKPHPQMLIYAGTKSAQMNWVRNLARHIGPHGVTINNLAPGVILTARNAPRLSYPAHRERTEQRIPLGRLGSPEDLVGAALLLCSDAESYINGANLVVDGGFSVA